MEAYDRTVRKTSYGAYSAAEEPWLCDDCVPELALRRSDSGPWTLGRGRHGPDTESTPSIHLPIPMRIRLSTPEVADDLVAALRTADCLAARTSGETIEVGFPWHVLDGSRYDAHHARAELRFFLRAWLIDHPGVHATVMT